MTIYPRFLAKSLLVSAALFTLPILANELTFLDAKKVPPNTTDGELIVSFGLASERAMAEEKITADKRRHPPQPQGDAHKSSTVGFVNMGASESTHLLEEEVEAQLQDLWIQNADTIRLDTLLGFKSEAGIGANLRYRLGYVYGANQAKRELGKTNLQTVLIDFEAGALSNLGWYKVHNEDEQITYETTNSIKAAAGDIVRYSNGLSVVYANQEVNLCRKLVSLDEIEIDNTTEIIFLAGPTDHSLCVTAWRQALIEHLAAIPQQQNKKTIVIVPEYAQTVSAGFRLSHTIGDRVIYEGLEQVKWEREMMGKSHCIYFNLGLNWELPNKDGIMVRGNIGPTVRAEIGYWIGYNEAMLTAGKTPKKILIEIPNSADNVDWVRRHYAEGRVYTKTSGTDSL